VQHRHACDGNAEFCRVCDIRQTGHRFLYAGNARYRPYRDTRAFIAPTPDKHCCPASYNIPHLYADGTRQFRHVCAVSRPCFRVCIRVRVRVRVACFPHIRNGTSERSCKSPSRTRGNLRSDERYTDVYRRRRSV